MDRELAVNGIDDFIEFMLGTPEAGFTQSVHLHATNDSGEWLLEPEEKAWKVTREHAKGTVAVRGTASDLLLLLCRRNGPEAVEVRGDGGALDEFLMMAALD